MVIRQYFCLHLQKPHKDEFILDTFLTINKVSKGLYRDKGSKFISIAYPCTSENQAKEILSAIKKEYYDAHHHCFAYVLGFENEIIRFSDDGEPSGSAGRPISGEIKSRDLCNIMVIVIRYFGGIKLGVRGLINAYQGAAYDALNQAEIKKMSIRYTFTVGFSYELINDVMRTAKELKLEIQNQQSGDRMEITFLAIKSLLQPAIEKMKKIYGVEILPEIKYFSEI